MSTSGGQRKRKHIPVRRRRAVYAADRSRCVHCHSVIRLEVDHRRPHACRGRNWWFNLFTLCRRCNKVKSDYHVRPDGTVNYHPFQGFSDRGEAAAILASERRACMNPARWLRLIAALREA